MKWYGNIGFEDTVETKPGVWEPVIEIRPYYGDVTSTYWKRENSGQVNDNINASNQISIVADAYAYKHCSSMAYIEFMNTKWKISNIEVQHPRLILSIGGVYNGPTD